MEEKGRIVDFDLKLLESFIEKRRPPIEMRDQLDISYRRENHSFVIYTIRPYFQDSSKKIESEIAKIRYVKSRKVWRLYWMRADLKWYFYEPAGEMTHLSQALEVVDEDGHGCFWG